MASTKRKGEERDSIPVNRFVTGVMLMLMLYNMTAVINMKVIVCDANG